MTVPPARAPSAAGTPMTATILRMARPPSPASLHPLFRRVSAEGNEPEGTVSVLRDSGSTRRPRIPAVTVSSLARRSALDDVVFLKALVESGAYRPVSDRVYPMGQAADAHRYVETWQKVGNVVLAVEGDA
ncbi:MAG TPA: zinc-binding dehydrogenase [Candidatus Limnocylindrales bacterium]